MIVQAKSKVTQRVEINLEELSQKKIDELVIASAELATNNAMVEVFDQIENNRLDIILDADYMLIQKPVVREMAQILDMNDFSDDQLQEICDFIHQRFPEQADELHLYLSKKHEANPNH